MTSPLSQQLTALATRAAGGDKGAFRELYTLSAPKLFAYLRARVPTVEIAEDLLTQTFLRLVRAIPRFQAERAGFLTWSYTIASRVLVDHYRATRVQVALPEDLPSGDSLEDSVDRSLAMKQVKEYLAGLPEQVREIVQLRYWDGYEYAEIAELLGKSEGAVKMAASRALRGLRAAHAGFLVLILCLLFV